MTENIDAEPLIDYQQSSNDNSDSQFAYHGHPPLTRQIAPGKLLLDGWYLSIGVRDSVYY